MIAMAVAPAPEQPATPRNDAPVTLHLTLENVRSPRGTLRICVWPNGKGFPDCKTAGGVRRYAAPAASGRVALDLAALPPGSYGISVMHDENDNLRLDKSFIGLPTEGVGFSNDAAGSFGPPKFEKVRFPMTGEAQHTIKMRYYL